MNITLKIFVVRFFMIFLPVVIVYYKYRLSIIDYDAGSTKEALK